MEILMVRPLRRVLTGHSQDRGRVDLLRAQGLADHPQDQGLADHLQDRDRVDLRRDEG